MIGTRFAPGQAGGLRAALRVHVCLSVRAMLLVTCEKNSLGAFEKLSMSVCLLSRHRKMQCGGRVRGRLRNAQYTGGAQTLYTWLLMSLLADLKVCV